MGRPGHGHPGPGCRRADLPGHERCRLRRRPPRFAEAYGTAVVESGLGGSIPFIAEFARTFPGAAVLVTGVGDPASRWHGIDESLHLEMFGRCVHAEALLLAELAPGVRS